MSAFEIKKEEKVWGDTTEFQRTKEVKKSLLHLKEGTYCSFHYHAFLENSFFMVEGKVRVVYWVGCAAFCEDIDSELTGSNFCSIPPQVPHQFQVIRSGIMIEEYHPAIKSRDGVLFNATLEDICRFTSGGVMQKQEIDRLQSEDRTAPFVIGTDRKIIEFSNDWRTA